MLETDLVGVGGPVRTADAFAEHWSVRLNRRAILHTEMTFYTLDRVQSSKSPNGSIRKATIEDFAQLAPLATAAARDMNLPEPEQLSTEVERRLRWDIGEGRQFMWVEGSSVRALASYADGLGSRGARIRGVYTPPEFRGRGYGTAITGGLADLLLRGGQSWVALFADNANLTSTRIYRRLGFAPEFVYRTWTFE
jgi:predicted GNAT family acetyltransferase